MLSRSAPRLVEGVASMAPPGAGLAVLRLPVVHLSAAVAVPLAAVARQEDFRPFLSLCAIIILGRGRSSGVRAVGS